MRATYLILVGCREFRTLHLFEIRRHVFICCFFLLFFFAVTTDANPGRFAALAALLARRALALRCRLCATDSVPDPTSGPGSDSSCTFLWSPWLAGAASLSLLSNDSSECTSSPVPADLELELLTLASHTEHTRHAHPLLSALTVDDSARLLLPADLPHILALAVARVDSTRSPALPLAAVPFKSSSFADSEASDSGSETEALRARLFACLRVRYMVPAENLSVVQRKEDEQPMTTEPSQQVRFVSFRDIDPGRIFMLQSCALFTCVLLHRSLRASISAACSNRTTRPPPSRRCLPRSCGTCCTAHARSVRTLCTRPRLLVCAHC